jgi:hypothetical protein
MGHNSPCEATSRCNFCRHLQIYINLKSLQARLHAKGIGPMLKKIFVQVYKVPPPHHLSNGPPLNKSGPEWLTFSGGQIASDPVDDSPLT